MNVMRLLLRTLLGLSCLFTSQALLAQAPVNDNLCNAIELFVDSSCNGNFTATNFNATLQPGEPIHSCGSGVGNTVWFRFVAPASGQVTISTDFAFNANDSTAIGLFELQGGNCNIVSGLCELSCAALNGANGSTIEAVSVFPGITYYVQVNLGAPPLAVGDSFCIEVTDAVGLSVPPNDGICNADTLFVGVGCAGSPNGTNTNASQQCGEPLGACFVGGSPTVWYVVQAPANGNLTVTTNVPVGGTNMDTELALYALSAGATCADLSSLVPVGCTQDDGTPSIVFNSTVSAGGLTPGEYYYVQVSGWNNTQGSFCIEALSFNTPPGDNICDAIPITVDATCSGSLNGDNTNATLEFGEPIPPCFVASNQTVWFSFQAPLSGNVTISTDIPGGTNDDTEIALYSLFVTCVNAYSGSNLTLLDCDQNGGTVSTFNSVIQATGLFPGANYYVQVSGWNGTTGSFCIEVSASVANNDDVCDATFLPVNGQVFEGDNSLATVDTAELANLSPLPSGTGLNDSTWSAVDPEIQRSLWYTFVAPASGRLAIDLCGTGGTDFNSQVALFAVGACSDYSSYSLLAANDDCGTGTTPQASYLEVSCLTPGETYYILVDGQDTASGAFDISLTPLPGGPLQGAGLLTADPACGAGGAILVGLQGGTPPLTYDWNPGPGGAARYDLDPGTYSLTLTDGCDSSLSLSASLATATTRSVQTNPDVQACAGGTFDLVATYTGDPQPGDRVLVISAGAVGTPDTLQRHASLRALPTTLLTTDTLRLINADLVEDSTLMYAIDVSGFRPRLVTVNLSNNTLTEIGGISLAAGNVIRGLAYDATKDSLYALVKVSTSGFSTLFLVDPLTANLTPIQDFDVQDPAWLAIDNDGTYYGFDRATNEIFEMDPATGGFLSIYELPTFYTGSRDADFDPLDNQLYLTTAPADQPDGGALIRVDLGAGLAYEIGGYSADPQRLALAIQPANPTPAPPEFTWTAVEGPAPSDPNAAQTSVSINTTTNASYVVSVSDGCSDPLIDTVRVQVSTDLSANISGDSTGQASVDATGGIPPYSYLWSNGSTSQTLSTPGTFAVTVSDAIGCEFNVENVVVSISEADLVVAGMDRLQVAPNPTAGQTMLDVSLLQPGPLAVNLYTLQGQLLWSHEAASQRAHQVIINLRDYPAGVYLLSATTSQGKVYQRISRE